MVRPGRTLHLFPSCLRFDFLTFQRFTLSCSRLTTTIV